MAATLLGLPGGMARSTMTTALSTALLLWAAGLLWDGRDFADYGLRLDRRWAAEFAFGLALGAALMLLIFGLEWAAGWVRIVGWFRTADGGAFLPALVAPVLTFLAVGFYEEAFVRGYVLRNLAEGLRWGPITARAAVCLAWVLSSAYFGLLHLGNPNATWISTLGVALGGLLLGLGYVLTGRLALPIGLHITWNLFQGTVLGFPVSGTDWGSAQVIAIEQSGPGLWTGGAFGPEAGLMGALAGLLGALAIAIWVRRRAGRLAPMERLAAYLPPEKGTPPPV